MESAELTITSANNPAYPYTIGPGLLESTYEQCLAHELTLSGIPFELQAEVPLVCKGARIDCGYRVDVLVGKQLIVELKCVQEILGIHEAQLLTHMKLANISVGLLMNFNVERPKDGLKRYVL